MNIILFGSGQGGQMAANWLPADSKLIAIADNNSQKWGQSLQEIPVIDPKEIPNLSPDLVFITILNKDAAPIIEKQLRELGYMGPIQTLTLFHQLMDLRLAHLRLLAKEINQRNLLGAVAELGVYQGAFAAEINRLFPERPLYLFDTFEGFAASDLAIEKATLRDAAPIKRDFHDTSAEEVLRRLPHPEKAILCKGHFPETLPNDLPSLAFVSLDADLYEPTLQGLKAFWPKLVPGAILLIHDYNSTQFQGVKKAVDFFCEQEHLLPLPLPDLHGSAILQKTKSTP